MKKTERKEEEERREVKRWDMTGRDGSRKEDEREYIREEK